VEKYGAARQATDDNIIRRMRLECWITTATNTHSEYGILIAFPRQQWLRERASMLHYTYIVHLVYKTLVFYSIRFAGFVDHNGGKRLPRRTGRGFSDMACKWECV
jgi:hypothetical protein